MIVSQNFQIHEPGLSKVWNDIRHLCCTVFVRKIEMTCPLCKFTPMKFYNMTHHLCHISYSALYVALYTIHIRSDYMSSVLYGS